MSTPQFCVSWMSYTNCISKGFSRLQQNGEFVDMTLAAEGHLVKVHQNIVALASPYLKAMIQSAPCQHPVVFLNNISQEILSFILEYIYTGEVKVPTHLTSAFIEVCKALCIKGVENLVLPKVHNSLPVTVDATVERPTQCTDHNYTAHITINSNNYNVEVIPIENTTPQVNTQPLISVDNIELIDYNHLTSVAAVEKENYIEKDNTLPIISIDPIDKDFELPCDPKECDNKEENQNKTLVDSEHNTTGQGLQNVILNKNMKNTPPIKQTTVKYATTNIPPSIGDKDKAQHYAISNRGSLQLLLNRYMYYCHHHSCGGRKRRWRCVDYRKLHCPAFIDTENDNIINRSEVHSHLYHDTKIMRKFKTKKVFTSLTQAEDKVKIAKEVKDLKVKKKVYKA